MLACSLTRNSTRPNVYQRLPRVLFRFTSQAGIERESIQGRSKTHHEVPGPRNIPVFGSTLDMIYGKPRDVPFGKYVLDRQFDDVKKYGKIFRLVVPAYGPVVCVADADAASKLFRNEPKYPKRFENPLLDYYRETKNKLPGVFFADGPDWYKYRSVISKKILRPREVAEYAEPFNEISTNFLDRVRDIRGSVGSDHENEVLALDQELFKWAFEAVAYMLFDKRFGTLEKQVNSEAQEFITSVGKLLDSFLLVGLLPVWFYKLYETKPYKAFVNNFDKVYYYAELFIGRRIEELKSEGKLYVEPEDGEKLGFLRFLLASGKLTEEDLLASVVDVFFAGVDTTSNTMQWVLYRLGMHPEKQEKLYQEIISVIKPGESPTSQTIAELPYLRAWMKETLRLYPVLSALPRCLPYDLELLGYNIPAGTNISILAYQMGRDNSVFEDADQFKPERWLRDEEDHLPDAIHAFGSLPFGFGTRMCIGRRIAELELYLLTIKTLHRHVITYPHDEPVEPFNRGVTIPDRPVRVRFMDRKTS